METTIRKNAARQGAFARFFPACAASIAITIFAGSFAYARDLAPEVVSRVWLDGDSQVASVTLNGDEIARFKCDADSDDAAEEAEELAVKLQEVITDKKFDPSLLAPAKDDGKSILKHDGNVICSFNPLAGQDVDDDKKADATAFDASIKVVNAIRSAFGAAALPASTANELAEKLGSKLEMLGQTFCGAASWYGGRFHGRKCSDGSRYDQERLTAAHRSLPFGTKVLVKNRKTGDSCVVEVNDRGPFIDGRVIDLSKAAAKELNMISSGVAYVECTILQ